MAFTRKFLTKQKPCWVRFVYVFSSKKHNDLQVFFSPLERLLLSFNDRDKLLLSFFVERSLESLRVSGSILR
jgi:hypothetical protein